MRPPHWQGTMIDGLPRREISRRAPPLTPVIGHILRSHRQCHASGCSPVTVAHVSGGNNTSISPHSRSEQLSTRTKRPPRGTKVPPPSAHIPRLRRSARRPRHPTDVQNRGIRHVGQVAPGDPSSQFTSILIGHQDQRQGPTRTSTKGSRMTFKAATPFFWFVPHAGRALIRT